MMTFSFEDFLQTMVDIYDEEIELRNKILSILTTLSEKNKIRRSDIFEKTIQLLSKEAATQHINTFEQHEDIEELYLQI